MPVVTLSIFALSVASGVVSSSILGSITNGIKYAFKPGVEREIEFAFNDAFKKWARFKISNPKKIELHNFIFAVAKDPNLLKQNNKKEFVKFYKLFNKCLIKYNNAWTCLKDVKDEGRFLQLQKNIQSVKDDTQSILSIVKGLSENNPNILEDEWSKELEQYIIAIEQFKPKTALDLIIALEKRIEDQIKSPTPELMAYLAYNKAVCHLYIGKTDGLWDNYIKAYELYPQNNLYREKACLAYARTKNVKACQRLIEEILIEEEYNVRAWFSKVLIEDVSNCENILSVTPLDVKNNIDYQRLLFSHLAKTLSADAAWNLLNRFENTIDFFQLNDSPVTFANYDRYIFYIESATNRYFKERIFYLSITEFSEEFKVFLINYDQLVSNFLKYVKNSEVISHFNNVRFLWHYTRILLFNNSEDISEMKLLWKDVKDNSLVFFHMLAETLQFNGDNEGVVKLSEEKEKCYEVLGIKAQNQLVLFKFEEYTLTIHELLQQKFKVDELVANNLLSIMRILDSQKVLKDFEIEDFIDNKEFVDEDIKSLITLSFKSLNSKEVSIEATQRIEDKILTYSGNLPFFIASIYFLAGDLKQTINYCRRYIDTDLFTRDLHLYVQCLIKDKSSHEELLELLKKWRDKFLEHDKSLVRIEMDLNQELLNWEECLKIADAYIEKCGYDENIIAYKIFILDKVESVNRVNEIKCLADKVQLLDFEGEKNAITTSRLLIKYGFVEVGFDLFYNIANEEDNKIARTNYFFDFSQNYSAIEKKYDSIEEGCYVIYTVDDIEASVKINLKDDLSKELLGKMVGDSFRMKRPMTSQYNNIKVLKVLDKYAYLNNRIMKEAESNPHSGLGLQSFKFDDMSNVESLNKTFIELFGADGTLEKENGEKAVKEYYNYDLSYTELSVQAFYSDPHRSYMGLVHNYRGVVQMPISLFPSFLDTKGCTFVIDISALFILFQIHTNCAVNYDNRFIISKGLVDYLKEKHEKEKKRPDEQMSLAITQEGVGINMVYKDNVRDLETYFKNLIQWIDKYCIVEVTTSKLDIIKNFEVKDLDIRNNRMINLSIDSYALMNKSNRLLISDDLMNYKLYPAASGKILSSEIYVKSFCGTDVSFEKEFLMNHYQGYTYSLSTLIEEYYLYIAEKDNNYLHCKTYNTLYYLQSKDVIEIIILFLKEIAINPVVTNEMLRREATEFFVSLLKGQKKEAPYSITKAYIRKEFNLLGSQREIINESYLDALKILNVKQ